VGYGPDPNECIQRISRLPDHLCLIGNHDQAALGLIPLSRFNQDAGAVVAWTQSVLTEESRAYLSTLPGKISIEKFTLAHGSPNQPIWEYILDPVTADRNFEALETDYALVGHSHLPLIFHQPFEDSFAMMRPILAMAIHAPASRSSIPRKRPGRCTAYPTMSQKCRFASCAPGSQSARHCA